MVGFRERVLLFWPRGKFPPGAEKKKKIAAPPPNIDRSRIRQLRKPATANSDTSYKNTFQIEELHDEIRSKLSLPRKTWRKVCGV